MKIAVIGAGIGGLASSVRLASRGHEVTVFEKNSLPGGKISEIREKGFRFDTGPSLFTLPQLIDDLFAIAGEKREDYIDWFKLESSCKYFFSNGKKLTFYDDLQKLENEIKRNSFEQFPNVKRRLDDSERLYNLTSNLFIFNDFHKFSNFIKPENKKILSALKDLKFGKTMHSVNEDEFLDRNIVQLFDRYATYNGSDPYRAPATLNMIAHLEHNIGTYFPQGGIYQIADALYRLAMKKGVTFEFDSEVENITLRGKRVTGVRVKGEDRVFDRVVCDADVNYVASKLIKHPLEKRLKRAELSTSALIFYWGINRKYDILDVHNVIFSGDYASEFKLLFERKILSFDPTIYIFVSSKAVPADAPDGCENWFVMLNAPIDSGQNWSTFINQSRAVVIKKINATLGIDLEKHIVVEKIATPKTIEKNTNSLHGALYGSASNSAFSAFLRHPNRVSGLKNIFFVGGSVHPGGGIPLCLASAAIVDKEFK